jgi:hypothetical protein
MRCRFERHGEPTETLADAFRGLAVRHKTAVEPEKQPPRTIEVLAPVMVIRGATARGSLISPNAKAALRRTASSGAVSWPTKSLTRPIHPVTTQRQTRIPMA